MKTPLLYSLLIALCSTACAKEANRKALNAYFHYEVSGKRIEIKDEILLQDNIFECSVVGDSVIYIHATRVFEGAGFVVRLTEGSDKDGTYTLHTYHKGFYENPQDKRIYYTNKDFKGILTLKNETFQGKMLIRTLHGTFEFESVDVTTGKSFKVTNGEFLMERRTR